MDKDLLANFISLACKAPVKLFRMGSTNNSVQTIKTNIPTRNLQPLHVEYRIIGTIDTLEIENGIAITGPSHIC